MTEDKCQSARPPSYPHTGRDSGRYFYDLNNSPKRINSVPWHFGTGAPFATIDVETTGTGPTDRIRSIQVGVADPVPLALVLLLEHDNGEPCDEMRAEAQALLTALAETDLWAYTHFDRRMIAYDLGVPLRINDAAALHHLVNSRAAVRSKPLKTEITARTGHTSPITAEQTLTLPVTDPDFRWYAALDAIGLAVCVKDWLDSTGWHRRRLDEWLHREQRIADTCDEMSRKGLLLDLDQARSLRATFESEREAYREKIDVIVPGMNPRSPKIAAAVKGRGVTLPRVRRKRKDGTSYYSDSMSHKHLTSDDELVVAVQGFRRRASQVDTVNGWLKEVRDDGRIHARFKPLGARSSRWSSASPNIQNVSKGSETGEAGESLVMRSAFVASPGMVWVQADLKQIEYRVAAALSGDKNMLAAFARGDDLHTHAARVLAGNDSPTKADRKMAKAIGFGKLYGEKPENAAAKYGVTVEEMLLRVAEYDAEFPRLAEWCEETTKASRGGWTPTNPYGRSLPVFGDYAGVNYTVQSTAREVFCDWMLNVVDAGFGPFLTAGIHDELILEVPESMAEEVRGEVERAASDVKIPGYDVVAIEADAVIAHGAWSAAYEEG